ncbi:hypothetical protein MKX01_000717, partial [Papaver californicum]
WSLIAGRLPGRTDNEVKNYWNTHLSRRNLLNHNYHHQGQSVITNTINCSKSRGLMQMDDPEKPLRGTTSTHENFIMEGILLDDQELHNRLEPEADVQTDYTTTIETQPSTSSEQRSDDNNESTTILSESLLSGESDNMEGCTFPDFPMISEDENLSLWLSNETIFYDVPLLPSYDYYFPVSFEPFEHNSDDDYCAWNKNLSWL